MANTIKIKRSAVPSKIPTTADLALGELAINTYDGKIYLKLDDGTESIVLINPTGVGTGDVTGPVGATDNAITRFDGTTGLIIKNSTATLDDAGVISISGANVSGLTASSAVATDASDNLISVANSGTGDNVLATSPTLVTPALGTPTALVGTNITGYASGLSIGGNSETVTTNANLTGAITSVGNATSIASQTGTGSTFVVDTSPTLITPNLGTPSAGVLTNCSGTATALNIGGTAALATSLAGGAAGYLPFQSATDATDFVVAGTVGQVLISAGIYAPQWTDPVAAGVSSVTGTSPISSSGGVNPDISISQAGASTSGYLSSTDWNTFNNNGSGTVNSVSGTGTVSGISLSGTVTSSGYLTLGGSLDLSSPPTIGNTAPNTGAFTTLSASGHVTFEGVTSTGATGTGALVFNGSPTLVTPNLGTPSTLIGTNITGTAAGLTAGTVTTNADLTGPITSIGNATSLASKTGTGSRIVVDDSPTLITPNLGTPSTLVGTNITGTAAGLTAGTVTTNANLTGMVTSVGNATTVITNANLTGVITSVGNATSIASQTGTGTKFVVDTSPTLVTPNLGTPTTLVATNASGTAASLTAGAATVLATARNIAGVSFNGSADINIPLANLSDVTLSSPVVNQLLSYNGTNWINSNAASAGAGSGVVLYNASPVITASGTQNLIQINTLAAIPVVTAELTVTGSANNAMGAVLFSAFASAPLGRTVIDAGVWDFTTWIGVNSANLSNTVTRQVYTTIPFLNTYTVTMTGTGTTRTATASGGTPFATSAIVASSVSTDASYLQTPSGIYQIITRVSDTVVTINHVPSTYTNETAVVGTVWKALFGVQTGDINDITPNYGLFTNTVTAGSYPITTATGIGILGFFTSTTTSTLHTVTITYNGTLRNTHVSTPLVNLHNSLAGLNGGAANEYYHLTSAEYTGTGTGVFVRASNAVLTSPDLDTPSALVGTNISGTAANLTSGHVTTNANLTGMVTSVGNATTVVTNANLTGGVTSLGNATTVVTNANLSGPIASIGNTTSITSQTGTGTRFVMDTSPTLVTPNLGTPTTLVGTNITGTASGLTAGTVTTNANLTGGVTSIGNAATVVTNANLTGGVTSIGNAATVVTNANLTGEATSVGNATTLTNSAVIGKVLTGYVSGAGTVAATDSILQAIQKLNGNIVATPGTVTSVQWTGGLITVANPTAAASLTVAGTSGGIPYFSSTSTWATSTLLDAGAIMLGGGAGAAPTSTTTGANVVTALGVTVGTAGAFVVNGGALGTPSSGTMTNVSGVAASLSIGGTAAKTNALNNTTASVDVSASAAPTTGQILTATSGTAATWQTNSGATSKIQPITASTATSALTVTLNPTILDFRSATLTSGTVNTVSIASAISVIVPSTIPLATVSAQQSRLVLVALYNAGTPVLGITNLAGGTNLDETTLVTTIPIAQTSTFTGAIAVTTGTLTLSATGTGTFALGQSLAGTGVPSGTFVKALLTGSLGAAASTYSTNIITAVASTAMTGTAGIGIYSTSAITSSPFRVVGYVESTQATAGTWATAPSTLQGYGGQALAAMSSLGYGQTWQDVTASRVSGTTYYNTTGRPITWVITGSISSNTQPIVNGVNIAPSAVNSSSNKNPCTVVVPPSASYSITATIAGWAELR